MDRHDDLFYDVNIYLKSADDPRILLDSTGKVASDPACCCGPTCPTASLVCDQISGSKSKGGGGCGFSEFGTPSSPPKFYLVETHQFDDTSGPGTGLGAGCVTSSTTHITQVTTYSRVDCSSSTTCDSTSSYTDPIHPDTNCSSSDCSLICPKSPCGSCDPGEFIVGSKTFESRSCNTGDESYSESNTLSDEYTTSDLIVDTVAALPPYDGVFDDDCGASRNLSSDETSYSISRYQYKFSLSSAAPTGMNVQWDQSGPDGTFHNTWTASGGETETSVFTQNEPSSNGTINTINITTTCP